MNKSTINIVISILLLCTSPILPALGSEEFKQALECAPNPLAGKKVYGLCAACHLENGWGKPDGSFPVIAGQHRKVLIKQLADIRARDRENPTMYPFSDPETIGGIQAIADVTAYIATLPASPSHGIGDGRRVGAGEKLYKERCDNCHGVRGEGNGDALFPRLQGQHYAYLVRQMQWMRDGLRKNGDPAMIRQLSSLSDVEVRAIADYISRLPEAEHRM